MVRAGQPLNQLIDLLRGGAAFIVLLAHVIMIFQSIGFLSQAFYLTFLASLSHESVLIFFMISGYLVGGGVWKKVNNHSFDMKVYMLLRINRLLLPLVPALLLTALLDHLGVWFFDYEALLITLQPFYPAWWNLDWTLSLPVFSSNILFTQMLLTEQYGTNLSLWTLSSEFWYYVLFPFMILSVIRPHYTVFLWLLGVVAFMLLSLLWTDRPCCQLDRAIIFFSGFIVWLIGFLAATWRVSSLQGYALLFLIEALGVVWYWHYDNLTLLGDVGFAMICLIILMNSEKVKFSMPKPLHQLSLMSYSLYLIHLPVVLFFVAIIYHSSSMTYLVKMFPLLSLILLVVFVIGIARVFYDVFEAHYLKTAKWLLART